MGIFGLRDAIKRTVNTLVGSPDIVAGDKPSAPSPPRSSPFAAAPSAPPAAPEAPTPAVADAAPPVAEAASEEAPKPATAPAEGPPLTHDEVWELLDEMVRPALQGDGGDIELIKVEDNDVHVKLTGACSTCPSSIMTMKMGVEALLREEFPQMRELIQHG
jgi:Fe-S cluster biogenesis protein NfuA